MHARILNKLVYLSNFTFIILYFVLAWHNRLSDDDFCAIVNLHQYGIIKGTAVLYNSYCTRWISVLVVNTILTLIPYINALFLLNIITIVAIIVSIFYFLKNIFQRFLNYCPEKITLLNLSIFTVNAFFYSSINIGNSWFWLSSIPTYLWSFTFFMAGCGIIISRKSHEFLKILLLAFSFFYMGGSAEAFAAVVLFAILITITWLHFSKTHLPGKKIYLVRLYVAFFFCLSSLTILYLGHGNAVRRELLEHISITKALLLNIKTTGWIGFHWISLTIPFILLFSLPFLYTGSLLKTQKKNLIEVQAILFKAVVFYCLLVFIINYPITYLLCGIAPGRALISVSFLTWALFAYSSFYLGYTIYMAERIIKKITVISLSFCIILNGYNVIHQFEITREYALKYDTLMEDLAHKKHTASVIVVSPLPASGMLSPLHLSKDSLSNNNMFLKNALGLRPYVMVSSRN